ncbi:hypothetical protein GF377_06925 [candidate division GN15 bacterium]|nr:hypothetical protein [candidate division GN15 bacterium]
MKRFEYIDHTADIIVKAYGRDLPEAFAAAAEGLFAVMTDEAATNGIDRIEFDVTSQDLDGLLVGLLSELIVRHEVDQIIGSDFTVELSGTDKLRCTARTEPVDPAKHSEGIHVKGISYHMLEIHEPSGDNDPAFVQVLFDV